MSVETAAMTGTPLSKRAVWLGLTAAGLALWLVSFKLYGAARAWEGLLIGFLYFTPLSGGLIVWTAVAAATNAKWTREFEGPALVGIVLSLPTMAALVLLWIGSGAWAPWPGKTFLQGFWLNNNFLFIRDLAALAVFWGLAFFYMKRRARGGALGPVFIVVYAVVFSLVGFDLVMALDPHWRSSLFGGYFFMSGMYIALAAWVLMSLWRIEPAEDKRHDFGRLIMAFSLITTYLMFAQLLPIWYENLPWETRFVAVRFSAPAVYFSYFLMAAVYLGPFAYLLPAWSKRNRYSLAGVSIVILIGMWVERWWLVAPTLRDNPSLGLAEISIAAAFVGVMGYGASAIRKGSGVVKAEGHGE